MEICVKVAYRARRRLRYNRVNQALRSGARDKAAWQAAFRKYPEIAIWVPFLPTVVPASLAGFLPPLNVDQHAAAEAASRGTAAPSVSLLTEFYQAIDEVDPDKVKKNKSFLSQFSCVSASDGDLVVRAKTKPFWLMSHAPLVVVKQLDDVKIESPQVLEAARIRTYRLLRLAEKHQADALCVLTLNGQPLHKPLKKDVAPYTEVQVFGRASPSTNLLPSMQGPEPGVAGRPPTSFSRDPVADPLAEHVTNLPGTPLPEGVE